MKNRIVTIIGNVAAGKSSAMDIVTKAVDGQAVYADDLFQTSDPFRELYLNDIPRWSLANETWLTLMRMKMLREAINKQKKEWLVVDSGLLMSWVYTYGHYIVGEIIKAEWDLYQELFNELTIDVCDEMSVLWLDYTLETLMYRLKLRGRDYELKYYTKDYLIQLQAGLEALVNNLKAKKIRVIHINESMVPEFVNDQNGKNQMNLLLRQMGDL